VTADVILKVGDRVTLRGFGEAAGVVVELLDEGIARVEWTTGKGLPGLRTLHRVDALEKLPVT
jgi:hypothetical protein